jgi:hypothetical protein
MMIVAGEPAEVRQLLIISSPFQAVSHVPIFSITYTSSIEMVFQRCAAERAVPEFARK